VLVQLLVQPQLRLMLVIPPLLMLMLRLLLGLRLRHLLKLMNLPLSVQLLHLLRELPPQLVEEEVQLSFFWLVLFLQELFSFKVLLF